MDILNKIKCNALYNGERTAVQSRETALTYAQLEEYSDSLAGWISRQCPGDTTPIVVYGHKNPYMIVCFLACVKAGHAYCPQDISIPKSRVDETVAAVEPKLVLAVEGEFEARSGTVLHFEEIEEIARSGTFYEESARVAAEDVFYIIFTSGSTGKPKGVQITTDCLNHYLDWSVGLGSTEAEKQGSHFLNQAPFSFDLSVMDLYTSLACGGTLYTMDKELQSDYAQMFEFFAKSDLDIWVSTPSFADMCLSDRKFGHELFPQLKAFLFCGEVLTTATAEKLMERFPQTKIINTYGPTESTVAVSDVEITRTLLQEIVCQGKSLPVGHEKPGTYIEIWDSEGNMMPEGGQGEIIIIGDTVSCGYYQRDDLTKRAFLSCTRDSIEYRAYKTGDAGYLKEGQLYYNGRIDLQFKLHGYRIEIEDIENNMVRLPQIDHAVVVPNIQEGKVRSLTAFVTGNLKGNNALEMVRQIKQDLKEILPVYMIPKKIKYIDTIPMTNHGKADRKYLGGLVS